MKTAIVGASGYSGELLVQLLSRHPGVADLTVASRTHAGKELCQVLPVLTGSRFAGSRFVSSDPAELAASQCEVFFLALPHGVAAGFALPLAAAGKVVIDLSADFRLDDGAVYQNYYGQPHPAADWLSRIPYILPEWTGLSGWNGGIIACPGCYPTSVLTPLAPLLRDGCIESSGIVINAVSGVSGAGKKADEFYSFCEREQSVCAYGRAKHRHLAEIEQELGKAAGTATVVQFTPHLVPMSRGIHATIVARLSSGLDPVYNSWNSAYGDRPFVRILPTSRTPDTRHVVGTNRVDISACADPRTGNVIITSAIDNLIKGAGGQAVQIFNLINGFDETEGLL